MEHRPTCLGFQVRISVAGLPSLWSSERRAMYLLTPGIARPLSVDVAVWPTATNAGLARQLFEDYTDEPHSDPNGLGVYHLSARGARIGRDLDPAVGHVVGLTARESIAHQLSLVHSIEPRDGREDLVSLGAQFLGFDVCDVSLLSGLMNCGTSPLEHENLRRSFGSALNSHGLFDEQSVASRFGDEISRIVPSHAPFQPIGLNCFGLR